MKKIVYIDMDGVLVDLGREIKKRLLDVNIDLNFITEPDSIPDLFLNPEPIEGAIAAINELNKSGLFDLFVATTAPWGNPMSLTHKRLWIEQYFGPIFHKKMFITHRKDLLIGDILIDDRLANGAKDFKGELIHFGIDYINNSPNAYPNWDTVLKRLLPII